MAQQEPVQGVDLLQQRLRRTVVVQNVIGHRQPLFTGGLGRNHGAGLCLGQPVPLLQALKLHGLGHVHHHHFPGRISPLGFHIQWYYQQHIGAGGPGDPLQGQLVDARMGDGLQFGSGFWVGKDVLAQGGTVQTAVGSDEVRP